MTNPFSCIANDTARYFTHQGINCMTQMGPYTINGYIELPEGHPWMDGGDLQLFDGIDVHGGITYHTGRIIGFDTNHFRDAHHPDAEHAYQTAGVSIEGMPWLNLHCWTWEEVETETRRLADQVKDTTND